MRKRFISVCTVLMLPLPAAVAYAEDIGVNLKAGTLGVGVHLIHL